MKYTDRNGVVHNDKLGLFLGNLGIPMKSTTKTQKVDPEPEFEDEDPIVEETIEYVELHGDTIIGKSADGKVLQTAEVHEELIYGYGKDMIQASIDTIDTSDKAMQDVINSVLLDQSDAINKVVKLYTDGATSLTEMNNGKLECMTMLSTCAVHKDPAMVIKGGAKFFERLFKSMEDLIHEHNIKED